MGTDIGPLLQRHDWPAYRDALLARFANPALQHSVHQIATDSSLKITLRWVPATLTRWHQGLPFARLAFAAAAWMRHARGQDDAGQPYALSDPLAEVVTTLARRHAGDAHATVAALGGLEAVWGTVLPHLAPWRDAVAQALHRINTLGLLAALEQENPAP
jgi:fructuronate reductase